VRPREPESCRFGTGGGFLRGRTSKPRWRRPCGLASSPTVSITRVSGEPSKVFALDRENPLSRSGVRCAGMRSRRRSPEGDARGGLASLGGGRRPQSPRRVRGGAGAVYPDGRGGDRGASPPVPRVGRRPSRRLPASASAPVRVSAPLPVHAAERKGLVAATRRPSDHGLTAAGEYGGGVGQGRGPYRALPGRLRHPKASCCWRCGGRPGPLGGPPCCSEKRMVGRAILALTIVLMGRVNVVGTGVSPSST
jgi:hypothetical protein